MDALIDRLLAPVGIDDPSTFRGCKACRLGAGAAAKVQRADDAAVRAFRTARMPSSQTSTPNARPKVRLVPAYRRP